MSADSNLDQFKAMVEHYTKVRNPGYVITTRTPYDTTRGSALIMAAYKATGFNLTPANIPSCVTLNLFKRYGEFLIVKNMFRSALHN